MSFVADLRCAMEGARLSPGDWIHIPDVEVARKPTFNREAGLWIRETKSTPSVAVRFDPAYVDAVPAPKPARRNYKAELAALEAEIRLTKTLLRHLLESYSSGDEQFHAACVADAHVLLAEVA